MIPRFFKFLTQSLPRKLDPGGPAQLNSTLFLSRTPLVNPERKPGMKNAGIVVLLVVQMLCLETTLAQEPANVKFREEASKQQGIYSSQGEKVPAGYVINRGLTFYANTLPAEFKRSLAHLGTADRWLDIGAGMGQAMLDYHAPTCDATYPDGRERHGKRAQSVALSIEDRRTPLWHQTAAGLDASRLAYFFGKPLQDYTAEELGKFHIITDLLGGFSYADNLSLFLEKTLAFLQVNGSFYTILQDVQSEQGANEPFYPGASYLTEIASADGSKMKICAWLKHVSCVKVTCELKLDWKPPVEVYQVQKICDNVSVPALVPTNFAAGTPPERRFRLASPAPVLSGQAGGAR
jgi:hypothetical protein